MQLCHLRKVSWSLHWGLERCTSSETSWKIEASFPPNDQCIWSSLSALHHCRASSMTPWSAPFSKQSVHLCKTSLHWIFRGSSVCMCAHPLTGVQHIETGDKLEEKNKGKCLMLGHHELPQKHLWVLAEILQGSGGVVEEKGHHSSKLCCFSHVAFSWWRQKPQCSVVTCCGFGENVQLWI